MAIMKFRQFITEKEETAMPKINEGDVMEGIFAIACALYIIDGNINKAKLNTLRTQIDPAKFTSGRSIVDIVTNKRIGRDTLSVQLQLRLKPKSVVGAFGKDFLFYVNKQTDIGGLDKKIESIIKNAETSRYLKKLRTAMEKYLKNNTSEDIGFMIVADGVEGEQSGGDIKGDVMITLYVKGSGGQKLLTDPETISYSIKSGSKTAANLSPYTGMLAIANHFSVSYSKPEHYQNILGRPARTDAEKEATNQAIRMMFDELRKLIVAKGDRITSDAYEYIAKNIKGSDQAFLVDIESSKIKEIPPEKYKELEDSGIKIKAIIQGDYLRFVDIKDSSKMLFQLRLKLRTSGSGSAERKFYVETGNLLY
jgi:hypothetical protein